MKLTVPASWLIRRVDNMHCGHWDCTVTMIFRTFRDVSLCLSLDMLLNLHKITITPLCTLSTAEVERSDQHAFSLHDYPVTKLCI